MQVDKKVVLITGANSGVGFAAALTGRFFPRSREAKTKRITYNTTVAARLWEISESLCGSSAAAPRRVFDLWSTPN